jgi:chemotaxis protein MotA
LRSGKVGNFLPIGGNLLPSRVDHARQAWGMMGPMNDILGHLLSPFPLIMVLAGGIAIALIQQGLDALPAALGALKAFFCADPDKDRDGARAVLLRAEETAHTHDVSRIDRLRAHQPFLIQALTTLANAPDVDRFAFWAAQDISDRRARHERAIGFWNALADAAPAMGMAGTIIGLIGMFARMSDPATIGPAMALALIATFDGMILANVIAGPIAGRLARLSARELEWQREIADRMIGLARREGAASIEETPHRRRAAREVA